MLIHIETRRRWNITISTTRHSPVDRPTGPSASPCTCGNSTFATTVDNDKTSSTTWYPKDSAAKHSSFDNTATISRCRTFLRKIYRLSVRIHRMDSRQYAAVVHDIPPPPYERGYELDAMPVHELPDGRMDARELEANQRWFAELESSMEHSNDQSFESETSQASYSDPTDVNELDATNVLQSSTSAGEPTSFSSLNDQYNSACAPSMISGGQSHNSSPVSPVTPIINGSYPTQLHAGANPTTSIVSPLDTVSPSDTYWPRSHLVDADCGYPSHLSLPASLVANPVPYFRGYVQQHQAVRLNDWHDDYLPSPVRVGLASHGPYIPNLHSPFASGHSLAEFLSQWRGTTDALPGGYEHREHSCQGATKDEETKYPEFTADQPGSSQHAHRFSQSPQQSTNYIELDDHQDPQLFVEPEAKKIDHPLEYCDQCDKTFRGGYRKGNLKRHVLAFHSPLAVVVGTACRVCKRAYKRADATRKHEWKKHRMPDAMPKKRARESRQPRLV